MQIKPILRAYGLDEKSLQIETFGSGLINHTWILSKKSPVESGKDSETSEESNNYILQRVNHAVFKKPRNIASNIRLIAASLKIHHPDYLFVAPVLTLKGAEMVYRKKEGYFRLFPFVSGSHSKDVVETPQQAFEAAVQFGRFTRLLAEVDMNQVKVTIPHFHDIELRYKQFLKAIKSGNKERIAQSDALIKTLLGYNDIVKTYTALKSDPEFKLRVTHHDTKISNVLFDEKDRGRCVIDLDTVMPGYFISDVGDMMRTYASSYWQTLLKLRLPAAMPFIFNALKINSTLALIAAIVAEFFGSPIVGMGFRISTGVGRLDVEMVWAEVAVAALAGSASYGLIALIERAVTFWHPSVRGGRA